MKTIVFGIFFFLFSLQLRSQSYNYIPFPNSGLVWDGYYQLCVHSGGTTYLHYLMTSDVVFKNTLYHHVREYDGVYQSYAYIREDSIRRIFFIPYYDTLEHLLCDFNVGLGDTIMKDNFRLRVTSIDTPDYLGIMRRTIHLSTDSVFFGDTIKENWIEGIGSDRSPIGIYGSQLSIPLCNYTICKIQLNQSDIYHNLNCSGFSNVNSIVDDATMFLFPNPVNSITYLHFDNYSPSVSIQIFNSIGELVMEKKDSGEEIELDVSSFTSGFYYIKVKEANSKIVNLKFIKAD